jgi:hypothetical protein
MFKVQANSISSIAALIDAVLSRDFAIDPETLPVVGAFWVKQATQFPGTGQQYRNHYLLVRVADKFGGCCLEAEQLHPGIAEELAGKNLAQLLRHNMIPVQIAALDAYFGLVAPHRQAAHARPLKLPAGTPLERALVRDQAIVSLLDIQPRQKVGLIGVVNPLVAAIEARGASCLPCDFNMAKTQSGLLVSKDMMPVLQKADLVIATGMTMSNGSFDRIIDLVQQRQIPLIIYAQTGSAIAPQFLGKGVTAVMAEPFPYSQFSADPTTIYLYSRGE